MTIVIAEKATFPGEPFGAIASKAWDQFFEVASANADLAHWMIQADSGVIRLTGRHSTVDESGPDWDPPEPVAIRVRGIVDLLNESGPSEQTKLRDGFRQWAVEGILKSFKSAATSRRYKEFNHDSAAFAIVASPTDEGLAYDNLTVIWSNSDSISASAIRDRQSQAQRLSRKRAVRKKPGTN